jgi:P-type Cu+ transporter
VTSEFHSIDLNPISDGTNSTGPTTDPVCGMIVDPNRSAATVDFRGTKYYFCAPRCSVRFRASPDYFLSKPIEERKMPSSAQEVMEYLCPMHPEIVKAEPGGCPKCGMALEPSVPSLESHADPELQAMTRRFWVAAVFAVPLIVVSMGGMFAPESTKAWLHQHARMYYLLQMILATPVVLGCGYPFFLRGWQSIQHRSPNMFTLIAMGVGVAYVYSLLATFVPNLFPTGFQGMGGMVEPYFESAAMIILLALLGQVMELKARSRTNSAVEELLSLLPKVARIRFFDGTEGDLDIVDIPPGSQVRVRPGERIPLDGVVVEGECHVDESMMTGEPMPAEKRPGDLVLAGTLAASGSLTFTSRSTHLDTMMSHIIRAVTKAQRTRAPIELLVDRISAYFIPTVLVVACLAFVGWSIWGSEPRLAQGLLHAISTLIIACPCALGLATPMAVMVGMGRGAKEGVLFRHAEALDSLRLIDLVLVDKTGTLTVGRPTLVRIEVIGDFQEADLLSIAAALEMHSEHPIGTAIVAAAKERYIGPATVGAFQAFPGMGITGTWNGKKVSLGNTRMLKGKEVNEHHLAASIDSLGQDGSTIVVMLIDNELAGYFVVSDPVKPSSFEAVQQLKSDGVRVVLATGDSQATAGHVAKLLEIEEFHAAVMPQAKAEIVSRLQHQGYRVAMVGDGVNDAVALAAADVGIAMGTGTDLAMESAAITLVKGDLRSIQRARVISRDTTQRIRQNLFLAFVYNAVSVPLAAIGWVSPTWASLAMSLSSVSVILNSLRRSQDG